MRTIVVTATEIKRHFSKYSRLIKEGNKIVITRYGSIIGSIIPMTSNLTNGQVFSSSTLTEKASITEE